VSRVRIFPFGKSGYPTPLAPNRPPLTASSRSTAGDYLWSAVRSQFALQTRRRTLDKDTFSSALRSSPPPMYTASAWSSAGSTARVDRSSTDSARSRSRRLTLFQLRCHCVTARFRPDASARRHFVRVTTARGSLAGPSHAKPMTCWTLLVPPTRIKRLAQRLLDSACRHREPSRRSQNCVRQT
jgi:hypothetical protein